MLTPYLTVLQTRYLYYFRADREIRENLHILSRLRTSDWHCENSFSNDSADVNNYVCTFMLMRLLLPSSLFSSDHEADSCSVQNLFRRKAFLNDEWNEERIEKGPNKHSVAESLNTNSDLPRTSAVPDPSKKKHRSLQLSPVVINHHLC